MGIRVIEASRELIVEHRSSLSSCSVVRHLRVLSNAGAPPLTLTLTLTLTLSLSLQHRRVLLESRARCRAGLSWYEDAQVQLLAAPRSNGVPG